MNSSAAISLKDWYTLVAVWEFYDRKWRLIKVTRLKEAIALCNQSKRLVFPIGINPPQVLAEKKLLPPSSTLSLEEKLS